MDHICQLKLHKLKLKITIIKKQRNFKNESYPMVFRQRRLLELFNCAYDIIL